MPVSHVTTVSRAFTNAVEVISSALGEVNAVLPAEVVVESTSENDF